MKHIATLIALAALLAARASFASAPSSFIGMGAATGTPTGDIRLMLSRETQGPTMTLKSRLITDEDVERAKKAMGDYKPHILRIGISTRLLSDRNSRFLMASKELLVRAFGSKYLAIYYLNDEDLANTVMAGRVDAVLAEADFAALNGTDAGLRPLLSLRPAESVSADAIQGSAIFVKKRPAGEGAPPLGALAGKNIAATQANEIGDWLAALAELVRSGIDQESLVWHTTFTGTGDYAGVLRRVLSGEFDAGVLPACALEELEREGAVNVESELDLVGERTGDALSCRHSTTLYPGLTLLVSRTMTDTTANALQAALESIPIDRFQAVWTDPAPGRGIYDLYYTLKRGPYSNLAQWNMRRILREHGNTIAILILLTIVIVTYALTLQLLVRRRTRELSRALHERELVELEASQSRQHIANLERTGLVGQMSTIIAHELKQPLGAIANYANGLTRRMKRGAVDEEQFLDALKEIAEQAERASTIVERVRGYARHDYPPRTTADLSVIIDNAIQTFKRSRTTNAVIDVQTIAGARAEVDEWEIELALLNLMKNAADAVTGVKDPKIVVRVADAGEHWKISVQDNGPEVSQELLEDFFKPLHTSKGKGGMGLGLSIVSNIAERHAGRVEVHRNPRRGVVFDIYIPKLEAERLAAAAKRDAQETEGEKSVPQAPAVEIKPQGMMDFLRNVAKRSE